jgi:RNA recognition motif-containing protein
MQSNELYVGNLDLNAKSEELREIFQLYGKINRCEVKFGDTSKRIQWNTNKVQFISRA